MAVWVRVPSSLQNFNVMGKQILSIRNSKMTLEEGAELRNLVKTKELTTEQEKRMMELFQKGEVYIIDENGNETKML